MQKSATQRFPLTPPDQRANHYRARRNAIGCALLVSLCVLITHPVLEMGVSDDPSYVRTALDFARTGHFIYNGWATATLGWQVLWGALFIKLFGFSFTVVRLSTLPIAMGSVYLLHQVLVRFGANAWNAILGTLAIGLSPLFLAVTATFLTDIPGFFCLLLCLYLCQRAVLSTTFKEAVAWLSLAAISNVIGGTVRQTAWVGALIFIPCTGWLLRRRTGLRLTTALLWFASVFAIYLCCHWFYRQPYFLIEKLPFGQVGGAQLSNFAIKWFRVLLSLVLFCLPVFIAFVPAVRRMPRRYLIISSAALIVGLGLSTFLAVHSLSVRAMLLPPWLMNNLNAGGIMNNYDVLGYRPGILSPPVQVALCALVVVSSWSFLAFVFARDPRTKRQQHQSASLSWHQTLWLVVPFTLAYTALLLPRGFFATFASDVLDRYLLPILPCVIILLVRFYQERVQPQLPILSFTVLTIFALWGIAGVHDLFSMNRARLAAADQVHRSGIPRTQIQASFEYDYWTQIDVTGHINDPRIHTPKNAYRQVPLSVGPTAPNRFWYAQETAAVQPRYFIVFTPQPSLKATEFAPTSYRTWLPPFGATVFVQQLP